MTYENDGIITDTKHPIESSFLLALQYNRFRALDHIFTKHLKSCLTELATRVKTDQVLNRKWNLYQALDLYFPTLLIWTLMRERSRPDIKKRLNKL